MIALLVSGCTREPSLPTLLPELSGAWEGEVDVGRGRAVAAVFVWTDAGLDGVLAVDDPDRQRQYELLTARTIEDLGVALRFVELTGVREATLDAIVPLDPLVAWFESRWYCGEGEDGWCGYAGALELNRSP